MIQGKGDDCGLQEREDLLIDGAVVEQVLGVHITNKLTRSKHTKTVIPTTKPIPPQETEKIWHGSSDFQKLLQLHHREPGMATA